MKENEININDIKEKLESLSERCKKLENKNNDYEKRIKRNEVIIVDLNLLLINLRKEYSEKVNKLKQGFEELFKLLKNKKIIEKEILINFEKNKNKKIIDYKGGSLLERFENQLFNIFSNNTNKNIPIEDICNLKKLSAALLIKNKSVKPLVEITKLFLEKNMNLNDTDDSSKINIKLKREIIHTEIDKVQLRKINKKDKKNFLKEFREKYGILEEEISEKELKYEIEYRKYDENEIIRIVLIRLGYI